MSIRWWPLALPAFVLSLGACVSGADLARDRASREFDCPKSKLNVRWLSSSQVGEIYRVRGCGVVVTYACDDLEETCIRESEARSEGE